jgi:hypothetical protein
LVDFDMVDIRNDRTPLGVDCEARRSIRIVRPSPLTILCGVQNNDGYEIVLQCDTWNDIACRNGVACRMFAAGTDQLDRASFDSPASSDAKHHHHTVSPLIDLTLLASGQAA